MKIKSFLASILLLVPALSVAQIGNPAPTVSLTSPANGTSITTSQAFTLSATASDNGYVAMVEFYSNNVLVGTDYDAPYSMSLGNLAIGSYTIYAKATDDLGKTKNSTSVVVSVTNAPPSVTLTSPNTSAVVSAPATLVLNAIASDDNGTITSVQFKSGSTVLYTDTTAPYSYTWANVPAGTYSLTAVATDNGNASTTSTAASVKVTTGAMVSATRTYVYDPYKRLCKTIEPETGSTVVDYDAAGNIAWTADGQVLPSMVDCNRDLVAQNQKVVRSYDAMNRLTAVTTPSGDADTVTTYFADGAVASVMAANPGGDLVTTTYTYNKRRLLIQEQLQINSLLPWTFAYAFNANGHLSSKTYPGNLVIGYAPDALGRPTQAGTFATGVTYYPNGAMSGFTYGNGIVHSMTQNTRQLPARSLDAYGSNKFLDDTFTYDANGNVMSVADAMPLDTNNRSRDQFSYDGLDRLKAVRGQYQWGMASYIYDALDNLRSNQLGVTTLSYTYDANNRLSNLSNGVGGSWSIGSDARGNVISDAMKSQSYEFDITHRMSAVTGKESYLYDGHGRRVRTLNLTTGSIEYYGYGMDGRLLQDWSNRRQVRNGYIYLGNTVVGLYEVNLTNGTVTPKYQHTDALGSPVVTTSASRTVLSRTSYTPFGLPSLPMDGVGYTGHFMDVGTQLTYMQQRYYDPQIGRFLSTDPVGSSSSGSNFSRYWYANDNPYRFMDPDGRQAKQQEDNKSRKERKEERDAKFDFMYGGTVRMPSYTPKPESATARPAGSAATTAPAPKPPVANTPPSTNGAGSQTAPKPPASTSTTSSNPSASIGLDYTTKVHILLVGVGEESSGSVDTNGQVCATTATCVYIGPGLAAESGPGGVVGVGNTSSEQYYFGFGFDASFFARAAGDLSFNSSGVEATGGTGAGWGGVVYAKVCQVQANAGAGCQ